MLACRTGRTGLYSGKSRLTLRDLGLAPTAQPWEGAMAEYKGYWIALVELAPLRWLPTIQRLDGRRMQDLATGKTFTIWECPRAAVSRWAGYKQRGYISIRSLPTTTSPPRRRSVSASSPTITAICQSRPDLSP